MQLKRSHPPRLPLASNSPRPLTNKGFTLVEMMVTIAVMAILVAIALPSSKSLIERWRVRNTTEAMRSTLFLARSEAMRRGAKIVVTKNANGAGGCTLAGNNEDWGCGWTVFVDANKNNKLDSGEVVLQNYSGTTDVNVTHRSGGVYFMVDRNGVVGSLNVKGFIFSPVQSGIGSSATRGICVTSGGRVKVIEDPPCS